jgi:hypothetical protein
VVVDVEKGVLGPGASMSWTLALERMETKEKFAAGTVLQMRPLLAVPGEKLTKAKPPMTPLVTPAVLVKLVDDFPAELKVEEIPEKWSEKMTVVYDERGIFHGHTWVKVDGAGKVTVVRSKQGRLDKEVPAGNYEGQLPAEELTGLAAVLRKQRFGERKAVPMTDQTLVTLVVSVGGAAGRLRFEDMLKEEEAALKELREAMRKVVVRVVREAGEKGE